MGTTDTETYVMCQIYYLSPRLYDHSYCAKYCLKVTRQLAKFSTPTVDVALSVGGLDLKMQDAGGGLEPDPGVLHAQDLQGS